MFNKTKDVTMWILGHTMLAYLVIKVILLPREKKLEPHIVFYIFIFANITDSLHFGFLRDVIHNPPGTILYSLLWLWIFKHFGLIEKKHFPILLAASLVHIPGDLMFSYYKPYFPFDNFRYTLRSWNSPENLITESIVSMVFFIVLIKTGDLKKLQDFINKEMGIFRKTFSTRDLLKPQLFPSYLILLFTFFAIGQFLLDLVVNFKRLTQGIWFAWIFTIMFAIFIYLLVLPNPLLISKEFQASP